MRVAIDTHLHVYPWYDLDRVFSSLTQKLAAFDGVDLRGAVLTERSDCNLFRDLLAGRIVPPDPWIVSRTERENELALSGHGGGPPLFLFAGRQIVTAERLEVLSLFADPRGLDGGRAEDVIRSVASAGGIPVLAWAPGKWLFGRRKIVGDLIGLFGPSEILVGDTTLRPAVWGEQRLMAVARRKGIAVAAGSDPLPMEGEEGYAGSYVTVMEGDVSPTSPADSVAALLKDALVAKRAAGRRCGMMEAVSRLYRNGRSKK